MSHIGKILEAAGCTYAFNGVYAGYFQGARPARITVQSVLGDGIKVEIDAVARLR